MRQILMAAAIMIAMSGCKAGEQGDNMVKVADRDLKRETRTVGNFDAVRLIGSYDVVYSQGKTTKVEVVAPDNVMDMITTEVKNGTLTISTKKIAGVTVISRTSDDVTVYVTSPTLTEMNLIGSGDITAKDPVKSDRLKLNLQGSGDMDFSNIECKNLTANLQGSGDMKISKVSTSETALLQLQGSGDFEVGDADSPKLVVTLQGSGDMNINRVSSADIVSATLKGSGDMTLSSINCKALAVSQYGGDMKIKNAKTTTSLVNLHGSGDMTVNFDSCSNITATLYGSGDMRLSGTTNMYSKQKRGSGNIYDNNLKRSQTMSTGSSTERSAFSPNGIEAQP